MQVIFAMVRETISFPFSTLGASTLIHVPPICRIAIFSSLPFSSPLDVPSLLRGANLVPPNPNIPQSPSSVVLIDRPTYPTTTNRSKILSGFSCVKERGFRMLEVDARSVEREARGDLLLFFIRSFLLCLS